VSTEEIRNEIIGILRKRNKLLIDNGQNPKAEYDADRIINLFDKAGWVELDSNQELPENPHGFTDRERRLHLYECCSNCHRAEREAMLKANWKKVKDE